VPSGTQLVFVEGFAVLASLLEWLKSFFVPAAFDSLMGYARLNGSNSINPQGLKG